MSSEKRKIAFIDGKPYEIGSNHTSILKFVKSYLGEKKVLEYFCNKSPSIVLSVVLPALPVTAINLADEK